LDNDFFINYLDFLLCALTAAVYSFVFHALTVAVILASNSDTGKQIKKLTISTIDA